MAVHQPFPRGTFKVEPGPGKNEVSVILKPTQSTIVFSVSRPGGRRLYRLRAKPCDEPNLRGVCSRSDQINRRKRRGCDRQGLAVFRLTNSPNLVGWYDRQVGRLFTNYFSLQPPVEARPGSPGNSSRFCA
jgi:hypothetical protein